MIKDCDYRFFLDIFFRINEKLAVHEYRVARNAKKLCQLRHDMNWHCSDIKQEKLFAIVSRNAKS